MANFNSKHRLWNCSRANTVGNILHHHYQHNNILIHHPLTHTHHSFSNNTTPSTIDLTITNGLHNATNFMTHTTDSNHDLITFTVELDENIRRNESRKIPLFRDANWDTYQSVVETNIGSIPPMSDIKETKDVDELLDTLTYAIQKGQDAAVPLVTPNAYAVTITSEIKAKIQLRNSTRRRAQRNPHLRSILHTSANLQSKVIRNEINAIANENFSHKISNFEKDK